MTSAVETAAPDSSTRPGLDHGRIVESRDGMVVYKPRGTGYELYLEHEGDYNGPLDKPLRGFVNVSARKVYTVPSGGTFIVPMTGTPRIIQGRVVDIRGEQLILHAGGLILVDLPTGENTIELGTGPIGVGALVNVVVYPGARFTLG